MDIAPNKYDHPSTAFGVKGTLPFIKIGGLYFMKQGKSKKYLRRIP